MRRQDPDLELVTPSSGHLCNTHGTSCDWRIKRPGDPSGLFFANHTITISTTVNSKAFCFLDQRQYSYAMLSWCNWQRMRFRQSQDASSNLVDNTADSISLDWSIGTDQGVGEVEQGLRAIGALHIFGGALSATPPVINATFRFEVLSLWVIRIYDIIWLTLDWQVERLGY